MPRPRDPKDLECTWRLEKEAYRRGWIFVAGCDEVGRGAMIGPLYAAAVILDPSRPITGIDDSKKLAPPRRKELADSIRAVAISYAVIAVSAGEVDAINVYQASRIAMIRAIKKLQPSPQFILTDAMPLWSPADTLAMSIPFRGLIHGDARSVSIAAASILAKVERDAYMEELGQIYPQYNLGQNKGYCTPEHMQSLRRHGPCPEHRKSFQPVQDWNLSLFPSQDSPAAKHN